MLKSFLSKILYYILCYKKNIIASISFSFAIILGVALYSFNPYDLSWFYYNSQAAGVTNLLGIFGANLSALFFYLFGVASFLCVPFFLYITYFLAKSLSFSLEVERFFAFLYLPFVGAALFNMYYFDIFDAIFPGGVLGNGIKIITIGWFDQVGAFLFLYVMLTVALFLIFRGTVTGLLHVVIRSASFVFSKQRFLIPVYHAVARCVWVLSVPFVFSFVFCRKLLCGEDVVGKNRSIVEFEDYILDVDQKEGLQDLYSSGSRYTGSCCGEKVSTFQDEFLEPQGKTGGQEIKKKMAEVIATGEEKIDAIMGKVEDLSVSQRRRLLKRMENVRRKLEK